MGKDDRRMEKYIPGACVHDHQKNIFVCAALSGQACRHEKSPRFAWAVYRRPHVKNFSLLVCKGKNTAFQVNDKKKNVKIIKITERKK